ALARAEAFVAQCEVASACSTKHANVDEANAPLDSPEAAYAQRVGDAGNTGEELPTDGPYALECGGLRGAGYQRLAQVALRMAVLPSIGASSQRQLLDDFLRRIDQSRAEYWRVTKAFLGPTA